MNNENTPSCRYSFIDSVIHYKLSKIKEITEEQIKIDSDNSCKINLEDDEKEKELQEESNETIKDYEKNEENDER